jgi:hypothetical protein
MINVAFIPVDNADNISSGDADAPYKVGIDIWIWLQSKKYRARELWLHGNKR